MNSPAGNGKIRLEMQRVSRQFRQGDSVINVLREANLAIRGGEMTALVGPSGSGKSTLLNIAGLLERPSAGDVIIDGTPTGVLGGRKRGRLRGSHVGFVFQFHRLLPEFSALENVMIPQMLGGLSRLEAEARAEQLLGMVGLAERCEHRPGALSGGEQQRVAIARAIAPQPKILLADEPTGNLDSAIGQQVITQLFTAARKVQAALVLITHDEALASQCERLLRVTDGQITEDTLSQPAKKMA